MTSFYCQSCKNTLNSKAQWEQHLTGSKHLKAQNAEAAFQSILKTANPLPTVNPSSNLLSSDMVDFSSASIQQFFFFQLIAMLL